MEQRFAKIDTDKDGRLNFNEYQIHGSREHDLIRMRSFLRSIQTAVVT